MPIIELSTALVAAGSGLVVPFVNKVPEKSAQRLGGHVDEHLAALFTRAHEHLAATGREAQSVEPKLLKAVVENAPYETAPILAGQWAALLANAADSAQRVVVQPGFAEVLRQLTPTDAWVLAVIAEIETNPQSRSPYYTPLALLLPQLAPITELQLFIIASNLARLGLSFNVGRQEVESGEFLLPSPRYNTIGPGVDFIRVTPFGHAFLAAVTPPTP